MLPECGLCQRAHCTQCVLDAESPQYLGREVAFILLTSKSIVLKMFFQIISVLHIMIDLCLGFPHLLYGIKQGCAVMCHTEKLQRKAVKALPGTAYFRPNTVFSTQFHIASVF